MSSVDLNEFPRRKNEVDENYERALKEMRRINAVRRDEAMREILGEEHTALDERVDTPVSEK